MIEKDSHMVTQLDYKLPISPQSLLWWIHKGKIPSFFCILQWREKKRSDIAHYPTRDRRQQQKFREKALKIVHVAGDSSPYFQQSADYTLPNSKTTATIVPNNKRIRESKRVWSKMWNGLFSEKLLQLSIQERDHKRRYERHLWSHKCPELIIHCFSVHDT